MTETTEKSETVTEQPRTDIPCGCGDYEIHIDEIEHIRELDVICPECKNHFGFGMPEDEHRQERGTQRE